MPDHLGGDQRKVKDDAAKDDNIKGGFARFARFSMYRALLRIILFRFIFLKHSMRLK
jgi:hypothetical protein